MDASSPSSADHLRWQDVLGSTGKVGNEGLFLHRLLQLLCQEHHIDAAALYVSTDDGLKCQLTFGNDEFPHLFDPDEPVSGSLLELPNGALVYRSSTPEPPELPGSWALALASAQQATVLRRHLKKQSFEVNYRGVELEALYDVGLAIASMLNLEDLGEEALLRAVSLLDARRGAVYLRQGDRLVLDQTFGGEAAQELRMNDPEIESLLRGRLEGEQRLLPGAKYLMALPIASQSEPQGLLVVADKESRQGVGRFQETDRRTLALFANQVAIALETAHLHRQALEKERLERELDLAAEIQRGLLPERVPQIAGYELAAWSRSARHVGGDYYDLINVRDGRVAAVLADVSGKGMPAALLVSTIHSALRLLIGSRPVGPELVGDLNRHISRSSASNRFITLFIAELDPSRDRIDFVNAGHNPALLIRQSGNVDELGSSGLPIGLFSDSTFEQGSASMSRGDLLCAYSDGITECLSPTEEEFGLDRLIDLTVGLKDRPLDEIVRAVDAAVTDFAEGQQQGDDQTLLFIRRQGPATGRS